MPKRKPKAQKFPVLTVVVGGVLLLISAIWLFLQTQSTPAPSVSDLNSEDSYADIERVSIADTRAALDAGTAVLVDVRIADAYAAQHIAGAINIPEAEIGNRLAELNPNQWIITYCT